MDILSASSNDDTIAWYENDGAESFTKRAISTAVDGAYTVYALDVDSDGDVDVLSLSSATGAFTWHENNGLTSPPEVLIRA